MLIIGTVTALVAVISCVAYVLTVEAKPNTAMLYAAGGGMLCLNLLITLFLIKKNFKDKK